MNDWPGLTANILNAVIGAKCTESPVSTWPDLTANILRAVSTAATAFVAWMLYRLNKNQAKDSWLRIFNEIHEAFWNDPVMIEVRSWLACAKAYANIKPHIEKRRAIDEGQLQPDELEISEYETLEKLDKFCNLLLRTIGIREKIKGVKPDLWHRLFVDYWLMQFFADHRPELRWYIERFYPELLDPELIRKAQESKTGPKHLPR